VHTPVKIQRAHGLGVVAYTCHPSSSGGEDGKDQGSRSAQAGKIVRTHLKGQAEHGGMYLSYQLHGGKGGRITV
jgi:hypothetical protein